MINKDRTLVMLQTNSNWKMMGRTFRKPELFLQATTKNEFDMVRVHTSKFFHSMRPDLNSKWFSDGFMDEQK